MQVKHLTAPAHRYSRVRSLSWTRKTRRACRVAVASREPSHKDSPPCPPSSDLSDYRYSTASRASYRSHSIWYIIHGMWPLCWALPDVFWTVQNSGQRYSNYYWVCLKLQAHVTQSLLRIHLLLDSSKVQSSGQRYL